VLSLTKDYERQEDRNVSKDNHSYVVWAICFSGELWQSGSFVPIHMRYVPSLIHRMHKTMESQRGPVTQLNLSISGGFKHTNATVVPNPP
jgi:hypothetical protein